MAVEWFYTRGGQRQGPVALEVLCQQRESGELRREDLVWHVGMGQWEAAGAMPEIGFTDPVAPATVSAPPAPLAVVAYAQPRGGEMQCTARVLDLLRQTRPWVRFIAILMFIGIGFMLIGGFAFIITLAAGNGGPSIAVGFVYVVMALLYLAPAVYLNRYASRITETLHFGREDKLEQAIEAQKSFWKFVGMMALLILIIYALIGLIAVIFAIAR